MNNYFVYKSFIEGPGVVVHTYNPSYTTWEVEVGGSRSKASLHKNLRLHLKITKVKKAWGVAQVAECLARSKGPELKTKTQVLPRQNKNCY
jgi:hypothetical protein